MFIKKDLRKIPEILEDENDERYELKLSKRPAEFNGAIHVLRISKFNATALSNLKILNLYDNHIKSLEGIGNLEVTPVEEINLGCNDLDHLPFEFGRITTIRSLWLDDNHFEEFPTAICQLVNLEALRFSSNKLSAIPPTIASLSQLSTLALDNNLFNEFPSHILNLTRMKHLWLRQNKLQEIPEDLSVYHDLETLSLSSNEISVLPTLIPPILPIATQMTEDSSGAMDTSTEKSIVPMAYFLKLQKVYLNGNKLSEIPDQWALLPDLKNINLANNTLYALPPTWNFIFADVSVHVKNGIFTLPATLESDHILTVNIFGNPVLA